jgi:hypothetical protein
MAVIKGGKWWLRFINQLFERVLLAIWVVRSEFHPQQSNQAKIAQRAQNV